MILTPDQVAMALLQASQEMGVQLTRDELIGLVSIPSRESGYDTNAHNPNRATGDDSYGLWQVNMLGNMGVQRARALGISDYKALFDPVTSAKAAIQLVLAGRKSGDPLHAWGGYKGKSNTYNVSPQAQAQAAAAVQRVSAQSSGGLLSTLRSQIYKGQGNSTAAASLTSWLQRQIGKPYKFGASDPNGDAFDCSGLISAAYKQLGIDLPPLTFSMKDYGQKVTDLKNLQPGDMLYTHGSQGDFGHVGIYIGGGTVIDAPHTGAFVQTTPLSAWLPRIQMVNRVMDADGNVIVGNGITPKSRPGLGQVMMSQAKGILDQLTPKTGDNDPFGTGRPLFGMFRPASGGDGATSDPATTFGLPPTSSSVAGAYKGIELPGIGGQVEPV